MSKVILITGNRKGIGKSLTDYYLERGHTVIGCSRSESATSHEKYEHFILDVSTEKEVVKMIRQVVKKYGKIDVLINNAGIASMNHVLLTPMKTIENVFNTNFVGSFVFLREVSKSMMKQKSGKIINFSTVAVPLNLEGEAIYASSKSAIETLTKIAAKELGSYGITVNAIGPTPVLTDLIKTVPKDKIEKILEYQAIKRFGTFEDISNLTDFFIDEKSNFITGQIIYLGGINK